LEDLQGGESKRAAEEDPTNLEANTLHSFKQETNIEQFCIDSKYFKVV